METLTLVPPIEIREPNYEVPEGVNRLTVIKCADGMEHFFVEDTGYYDGWSRAMSGSMEDAEQIIESVQNDRQIEPPAEP